VAEVVLAELFMLNFFLAFGIRAISIKIIIAAQAAQAAQAVLRFNCFFISKNK